MVTDNSDCGCPTEVEEKKGPTSEDGGGENSADESGEGATATHRREKVGRVHFASRVGRAKPVPQTRKFK